MKREDRETLYLVLFIAMVWCGGALLFAKLTGFV